MLRNRVAAIDHGPSRTAIGVFSHAADGRLSLLDFAWIPHAEAEARAGGLPPPLLAFLRDRTARRRFRVGPCVLVPSRLAVLVKTLELPPLDAAKREAVLRFEAQRHLPVALEQLVWRATGHDGAATTFAAVRRDEIDALLGAWATEGWPVAAVVPAAMALPGSVAARGGAGGVMVEVAEAGSSIVAWSAGRAIRRVVGVTDAGGTAATREAGRAGDVRLLHEMRQARMAAGTGAAEAAMPEIWLAGPAAAVARVETAWRERNAGEVRRWDPWSEYRIDLEPGAETGARLAEVPALFGAAAGWLRGELPVNLAPARAGWSARAPGWRAAAALLAGALALAPAGAALALRHDAVRLRREEACWRGPVQETRVRAQQLAALARERQELQAALAQSEAQRTAAQWWPAWLQELQEVSGRHPAVVLDRLAPESAGVLVLAGRAEAGPAGGREEAVRQLRGWLAALRASRAVAAVGEERFENEDGGGLRFTVRLSMNQGRWW